MLYALTIFTVRHHCHTEEKCPPCTELTDKLCMGEHMVRCLNIVVLFVTDQCSNMINILEIVSDNFKFLKPELLELINPLYLSS